MTFTALGRKIVKSQASKALQKKTGGHYPAPPAALESCIYALEHSLEESFRYEAKELGRLLVSPECKALVNLFFLTESAKSIGRSAKKDTDHVQAIVIGAGVMGAGIAGELARKKCQVILKDTSHDALDKGTANIKRSLDKKKYLSEAERSFILNRIETTTRDSPNLGNCNFAIEAIVEKMEVKQKVLGELALSLPLDAIIASNTSSLSISEIAETIPEPERVIGMHFFNPVDKMPLVEIICGKQSSDRAVAVVAALTTKLGKFPIVVQDVPGFLVNRILSPYLNEAGFLLKDGFGVEAIDKAAKKFGMPMGPIRLLDEVGLDVATHVGEIMVQGYGERMLGPDYAKILSEKGLQGKKNGSGFYLYDEGRSKGVNPELNSLLDLPNPKESGKIDEISDRLVLSLINEGVRCLDEGVAGTPGKDAARQIDLGTVMGTGFPPFRGGLVYYAEKLGAAILLEKLERLESTFGSRFSPAEGIRRRAQSGGSFYEEA